MGLVLRVRRVRGLSAGRVAVPVLALASAALFGLATPATKSLVDSVGPFTLAGLLYLGAAAWTSVSAFRGDTMPVWRGSRRTRYLVAGAILFGGILGPVLLLLGLRLAGAADVSLWLNLELVATAVIGHAVFKDRLGRTGWLATIIVLAGAIILSRADVPGLLAAASVALACVCWSIDNHLTALIDGVHPAQSTFWKGLIGGMTNFAIGLLVAPPLLTPPIIGAALGIGALSYGASIVLYIHAAHGMGATRAQLVFATAPLWGIAGAVAIFGEVLTWRHFAALALMTSGIALLLRETHAHDHHHERMTHTHAHRHDDGHHTHSHAEGAVGHAHIHEHDHEALTHRHPHWPDLHHRHRH